VLYGKQQKTIFNMTLFLLVFLMTLQVGLVIIAFMIVYFMFFAVLSVPWVPTRKVYSEAMLKLANVKPDDVVMDLGCGDASILIEAAKEFGVKRAFGIEARYPLVLLARFRAKRVGVGDSVEIVCGNMYKEKWPEKVDVIALYLFTEVNKKLEPLILDRYKSGTRVVSRAFTFSGLKLVDTTVVKGETLYFYQVP
jgi:precorrin-6B methylase 2